MTQMATLGPWYRAEEFHQQYLEDKKVPFFLPASQKNANRIVNRGLTLALSLPPRRPTAPPATSARLTDSGTN